MRAVPTIEEPVPAWTLTREAIEKLTEEVRTLAAERSGRVAAIGARTVAAILRPGLWSVLIT